MRNTLVDMTRPLPVHPNGVVGQAIGWRRARSGETEQQPIWSMAGGSGEDDGGGDGDDGDKSEKDKDADDADKDKKDTADKDKKPAEEFVSKADFERMRKHLSESDRKKAAAEAELAQLKGKDLPEAEKLKADLDAATTAREKATAQYEGLARTNAFLIASSTAGIHWQDPKVALKVGDFADLVIDDDGDVIGMADAVKKLAKDHGYLVKPKAATDGEDEDDKDKRPIKSGSSVGTKGTKGSGKTKLSDEELRRRFPALR